MMTEIPLNWRLGLGIRKETATGETRVELLNANYGSDKVMQGGPTCKYNGVELP
jgi:hypothetical protein